MDYNGYFERKDPKILARSAEDLRRASLSKNRKILDPLVESFKGSDLEERAVAHYSGPEGERLARLLTRTDLKAVNSLAPKGESAEAIEAALGRSIGSSWRSELILETETHGAFQAVGVERAAAIGRQSKTWRTQRDHKVRPSHRVLEGIAVDIDAVFPNGEQFPVSPRCRCWLEYSGYGPGRDLVLW